MKTKLFSLLAATLFASSMLADSYTLAFKDCASESMDSTARVSTIEDIIADGANYVAAIAQADNVFNARSGRGLKLGVSNKTGTLELTLANALNVTSIVVNARGYGGENVTENTLKIQDKADYETTAEFADYTYAYSEATSVSSILIGTVEKRAYIKSVTINFEAEGLPDPPVLPTVYTVTIDGIAYNLNETDLTAEVTSGGKYSGSIVIPESVTYDTKTYSVTSIGSNAFQNRPGLRSVTIPNSVTSIGNNAFYSCSGLASVAIPNSVTSIGDCAFRFCYSLTSVTIGNSITSIGEYAFCYCTGLTSVTIPNSVTSIGEWAFSSCSGLTSVTIGNSVTSIGEWAFSSCSGLTSVTIPNSVISIGNNAFYGCSGLTSITIPNSVTSIGRSVFLGCDGLTDIYSCGDVDRIKRLLNYDNRVKLKPLPYTVTPRATNGTITSLRVDCESVELTVTSNYGYHFTQWSDGNTDNPRVIFLTQDTTVTAEIAKNSYTIYDQSIGSRGHIEGAGMYMYLDTVVLTAISNFGYHFTQWSDGNTDNPRTVELTQDTTFTAEFAINQYAINVSCDDKFGHIDGEEGVYESFTEHTYTAVPNYGYHFDGWEMSATDLSGNYIPYKIAKFHLPSSWTNPYAWVWKYGESGRWEQLNYKNGWYVYDGVDDYGIIIVPNGTTWYNGQTSDIILDDYACYSINTNYVVTRLPNNDENITISLVGNITLTAEFSKNSYVITDNSNHDLGHIEGIGTFEYLDEITLTPVSNYGYHFAQWSDGNTDNPRVIVLTKDTTFTAEFAIDKSGTCGENNALTWTYDDQSKTLTITGDGALTSNYTFGLEAPVQMNTLIIGDGVTAIGDSAFYGMSTINHLFIGANVAAIGNYAFAECRNFDDITCYATVVPTINATTFANVGNKQYIYLYVPEDRERAYKRDEFWGEFDIRIKATETTTTDTKSVTVDPSDNTAVFTWPTENSAASYSLQITKDGVVFCTLVFNGDGQLIGIAFAPSRNGAPHAPAATMSVAGMSFTVTGLNSASKYAYHLAVKDANDNEVQAYSGEFATTGYDGEVNPGGEPEINTEGFEDIQLESDKPIKIFYHGQILILRGDRTYTLTGQEVK